MRVCFFGLYDPDYPRNAVLLRGLAEAGVQIDECRGQLALGATPSVFPIARTARLVHRWRALSNRPDVLLVPTFNQELVPLAKALAYPHRLFVVHDFMVSLWDTAVNDRGRRPRHPNSLRRRCADVAAVRCGDLFFSDTPAHAEYLSREFGAPPDKMRSIHVGAPEWEYAASPVPERGNRPLRVLWYGTYIPLHGAEFIVQAARELRSDARFRFVLHGPAGQTYEAIRALHDAEASGNLQFMPPVRQEDLPALIASADICLGIFGTSEKARRVVANKVWQAMASGRPLVTGNGPGARSVLAHERDALLVPHADGSAIAAALRRLADDFELAQRIAHTAAERFRQRYTSKHLGAQLADLLRDYYARRNHGRV